MPKKGIHPNYHMIKLVFTDGNIMETRSTWGKEGDMLHLDINPMDHPAWTGKGHFVQAEFGRVASYKQKYSGL